MHAQNEHVLLLQLRPVSSAVSTAPADGATAVDGGFLPHPGAFPAHAPSTAEATAAIATSLPDLDGLLSKTPASAVPDLNAIPEDAALPSGPLPPPAVSMASEIFGATANGDRPQGQAEARMPTGAVGEGQPAPAQRAEQQSQPPPANGYLPSPRAEAAGDGPVAADPPAAKVPAGSAAAPGEHGTAAPAASAAAADSAALPGSGPSTSAEAHPLPTEPDAASAGAVGAAPQPGSSAAEAAQDGPRPAVPAAAAQQPGSAAEHGGAGTVAAAEAAAMAVADRAIAVEEAMEVRPGPSACAAVCETS